MATAVATTVTKISEVTLTLSEDEARTLLEITGKIGGSPTESDRRHTDAIGSALYRAGLVRKPSTAHGSLSF